MTQWRTARLEDVAQVLGGGTPSRTEQTYFGGGIAWATPTDITKLDRLYISQTKETVSEEGLRHSSTKLMPSGAVLLTSRATIGFTAISTVPICTNQGFINFICGPDLVPEYLAYWLRTQRDKMIQHAGGTTFKEIARGTLRKFEMPVPPLPDQRRIVDLLSRAEGIVRLRREAEKKAAELIPALFLDMFGDPATNPRGWKSGKFADVVADIRNGFNPTKDQFGTGTQFITVNGLYNGLTIDAASADRVSAAPAVIAKYRLQRGDLCFVRSSVKRSGVGMASVFDSDDEAVFGGFVIRAQLTDRLLPIFACAMFHVPSVRKIVVESAGTGTITNINQPALLSVPVIEPPLELQQEFARRVQQAISIQNQQSAATAKAKATFDALLTQAFSG